MDKEQIDKTMDAMHAGLVRSVQQRAQMDSVSLNRDADLGVERYGLIANKATHNYDLILSPAGSTTPHWIATIPARTAFTREELKEIVYHAVKRAVEIDREHRPDDGWVQRDLAAQQMLLFESVTLRAQHVPADAIGPIMDELHRDVEVWCAPE